MKKILRIGFMITLFFVSKDAFALVTHPAPKTTPAITTFLRKPTDTQPAGKLKLKEKIALWVLKRKLKKWQKKNPRPKINPSIDTTYCATILLNTGEELKAKLLKVTDTSVKFVRCGTQKVLTLSKSDIVSIMLYDQVALYQDDFILKKKNLIKRRLRRRTAQKRIGAVSLLFSILALLSLFVSPLLFYFFAIFALTAGLSGIINTNGDTQKLSVISFFIAIWTILTPNWGLFFQKLFNRN